MGLMYMYVGHLVSLIDSIIFVWVCTCLYLVDNYKTNTITICVLCVYM